MMKSKKRDNRTKKRRRTSLEIEEEQTRTLYIRLPHPIKGVDEIKSLFFGDFHVKLPRQTTRFCHVIFKNKEDKVKNMKAVKKTMIDGKPIFAGPPRPMNLEKNKKPKHKKIVIPEPKDEPKIGKYLFISNIAPGVKASEVKNAFPGSVTVALLKGLVKGTRHAKVKMSSPQLCLQYIKNESQWPELHGKKVSVSLSKHKNNNNNRVTAKKPKSKSLKIYGEDEEQGDKAKSQKSKGLAKSETESNSENESDEDEDEVEEEEEEEESEEEEEESEEEEEETEESSEE